MRALSQNDARKREDSPAIELPFPHPIPPSNRWRLSQNSKNVLRRRRGALRPWYMKEELHAHALHTRAMIKRLHRGVNIHNGNKPGHFHRDRQRACSPVQAVPSAG